MKQKPIKTIADLGAPQAGQAQMIPFHLWEAYQKRYGLRVIKQDWNTLRGCPVVYTQRGAKPQ
jgi:hypothetical protein